LPLLSIPASFHPGLGWAKSDDQSGPIQMIELKIYRFKVELARCQQRALDRHPLDSASASGA
jgi:hypothetical protein